MVASSFNSGWQFAKEGTAATQVLLPHDAMIHERRTPNSPGGSAHGYFPGGRYIYEKAFTAPAEWAEKTVLIEFEGVYKDCEVSVNGEIVAKQCYGYVPFQICLDGLLNYGGTNQITMAVDNADLPNSRWYTGTGIYRPVNLVVGSKTHIDWQGVRISTVSYSPAIVQVDTRANGGEISVEILDDGKVVAAGKGPSLEMEISNARLWSDASPHLYTCHVILAENGETVDEVTELFGIRKVDWSNKGLFINGAETLLRGGCFHHDNGILGAAAHAKSEERRVRIMKEAGFNALRSSHNPTSKAMLAACDKYGMYLIDETWDMWYSHKSKYDYAGDFMEHYQDDIRAMVERDFNHPSAIMYSIGNEVAEPAQAKGVSLAKEMVDFIHGLDKTRAVTGGMNLMIISRSAKGNSIYKEDGGRGDEGQQKKMNAMSSTMFNMLTSVVGPGMNKGANSKHADAVSAPVLDALDIAGYNYASGRYPLEGKAHPSRVIFGSETFPQDIYKNWQMVKKHSYLLGDFMWTAWDYLGEAGIGAWAYTPDGKTFDKPYPWVLADVGVLDLLGNPGGGLFLAQATWGLLEKPAIAVQPVNHPGVKPAKSVWRGTNALPSWSWRGCEENRAVVEVYTDAFFVELFLNGKSVAKKKPKECKAVFKTKYAPGMLVAVAYDKNAKELSRNELLTASGDTCLRVTPEASTVPLGEIVHIPISITGENGVVESNADEKLTVAVACGELLAFGSANPRTEESYNTGSFTTYYGHAMAVVRCTMPGVLSVTVSGDRLKAVTANINVV